MSEPSVDEYPCTCDLGRDPRSCPRHVPVEEIRRMINLPTAALARVLRSMFSEVGHLDLARRLAPHAIKKRYLKPGTEATEGDAQHLTVEIARLRALIESAQVLVHVVAENWDCDCDEHRYGTGCRSCEAAALAARLDEEVSRG